MKCEWILCPVCGSKTRNKIRKDTVLENYPLYCPKCRQESLIKVDNNVWFGGNVTVLPNVTIGDNCVIGAGSVVTKDISANSLAIGNPAKVIKEIEQKF